MLLAEEIEIPTASMDEERGRGRREAGRDFLTKIATPPPKALRLRRKMLYELKETGNESTQWVSLRRTTEGLSLVKLSLNSVNFDL